MLIRQLNCKFHDHDYLIMFLSHILELEINKLRNSLNVSLLLLFCILSTYILSSFLIVPLTHILTTWYGLKDSYTLSPKLHQYPALLILLIPLYYCQG